MDELTPLLQRFTVEVVEASRQVSRDAIVYCMNTVIQPIISSVVRADARFKCYVPLPTEHYFEAMKVSASDEFELIVVLDSLVNMKSFRDLSETNPSLSCYGEVVFAQSFANDMWAADLCVPGRQGPHSFLSAAKIRQNFAKLVALIAADIFHNGTVQVSYKGIPCDTWHYAVNQTRTTGTVFLDYKKGGFNLVNFKNVGKRIGVHVQNPAVVFVFHA